MHYAFDAQGWYTAQVDDDAPRSVPIAPPIDSITTTTGADRARWCRFEWRIEPYQAQEVPDEVEMWAAREVLIEDGLIDAVEAAIDAIQNATERRVVRNRWDYDTKVQRTNAVAEFLRQQVGITEAQRDALFIRAATKT